MNSYSPKCVEGTFCELRLHGVLRSSRPDMATWHTKILHMGDALQQARLLPYLCNVTRGQGGRNPSRSAPTKPRGGHVLGAQEELWRELRAHGAQIDAAARAEP